MSIAEIVARTGAVGLLAFDPAGALLALAAISLGVRRRGLATLTAAYVGVMVALGLAATALVHLLQGTRPAELAVDFWHRHHLLGLVELVAGLALIVTSAVLWWRAHRARARPDGETRGDEDAGPGRIERLAGNLTGTRGLAGAGALLAASLLMDPAYPVMAVATQPFPLWSLVPAWAVWALISQSLMLVLVLATFLDRGDRLLDRVTAATRRALVHTGLVVRVVLLVAGLVLVYQAWSGTRV